MRSFRGSLPNSTWWKTCSRGIPCLVIENASSRKSTTFFSISTALLASGATRTSARASNNMCSRVHVPPSSVTSVRPIRVIVAMCSTLESVRTFSETFSTIEYEARAASMIAEVNILGFTPAIGTTDRATKPKTASIRPSYTPSMNLSMPSSLDSRYDDTLSRYDSTNLNVSPLVVATSL